MVDQPSEEDRLGFVRSYGVEPVTDINTDLTFKDAALSVAEMTPIIGDAMAAKEVYDELMKEDPNYKLIAALGGAALIGAIPGIGDAAAAGIRKAADVAKRIEVDPDAVGMMGGNIRLKPKKTEYDAMIAELDKAETIDEWQTNAKALIKEGRVQDPVIRTPELEDSTRQLLEGKITRDQHLANVDEFKPVSGYDQLPREPSDKAVVFGLNDAQRKDGHFLIDDNKKLGVNKSSLKVGDDFNGRLDIPAYNAYDVWIVTGNSKQAEKGKHYLKAVHYEATDDKPVRFLASEKTSERIGTGEKGKTPYATVAGRVKDLDVEKIRATAAELLDDPEWTQVGFDPRRQGGFYVRAGKNKHVPVREATEVIQIGPLVLAKNAKLDLEYQGYNEGGMTVQDQMEMNFGTRGVDPVSGNEVPVGSLPEEVRDDIPAQLSEGEYVVPADVVRYYGVKFFEDLRIEAKLGFDAMDAAGRIGGEPVAMNADDEGLGLDLSDLEVVEVQAMSEGGDTKGAYTFDNIKKKLVRKQAENKPVFRNRAEEIIYNIRNFFGDDDDKPKKATNKPPIDFGFGGNPMERAERKYGSPSSPTKNESYRPSSATQREVYKPKPNQPSILEQINFNEGGTTRVVDEGTTGQLLPDNFDPVLDSVGGGVMEMREYQNAAGHTLMIPFLDGIPQTVIPDGYFPVGSTPVVTPVNTAGSSGSRNDDDDDKKDITEPFNYKELTIDELTEEVKNLQETPNFLGTGIFSGIVAIAQKRHRNKLIQEIDRRLSNESFNNPNAEVFGAERSYLENLKEVAEAPPEKGMVGKFIDKITGEETEQPDLPNLEEPKYSELPSIKEVGEAQVEESYTPEAQTDTSPSPSREKSAAEQIQESIKDAADRRVIEEAKKISAEAAQKAFKTSTGTPQPTPVNEMSDRVKRARQNTQEVLKDMRDRGASREERTAAMAAGARTEQVLKDLDRGVVRGFEKGGSVDKPKVKEVVKGLKKASKTHAKQAATLEKAMKAKKKKSK